MQTYQVFNHPEKGFKAVKDGFSWPGFFFTSAWALSRRLWLVSAGLILFSVVFNFLAAGIAASHPMLAFALGLIFAFFVGLNGNKWHIRKLYENEYSYLGKINANSPLDAVSKVTISGGVISAQLRPVASHAGLLAVPSIFQGLFAIVGLTWKAAFRYRLFWVVTSLLLVAVVALPLLLKDDGTAAGFAQILITYTLSAVTGLLGLCTLWLACGTLARDIEDCQIQMVAVKPIARWQIWAGKWLGLVTLDAVLLAVAGLSIFGLLEYRARKLPADELFKLQNEVLVARASVREPSMEAAINQETDREYKESLAKGIPAELNPAALRQQIALKVRADVQVVQPNETRLWRIPLGAAKNQLKDQPLYVRMKFNSAKMGLSGNLHAAWQIGFPKKTAIWQEEMSVAPDTFYEFKIDPNLFDEKGDLYIAFLNVNDTAVLFTLGEGMEVLYRQGGFGLNFVRGLGIILCWLGLLAALGLASATFLSFPVAAFFSLALLMISFSTSTLTNVVNDGTLMGFNEEKGTKGYSPVDILAVPTFKGMLEVINLVQGFAPIDALSTGRLISTETLGQAILQIVVLMGGLLALGGIFIFSRRELATAQGTQ